MSGAMRNAALIGAANPGSPAPGMLLGTVSAASTTGCSVILDGASTATVAIVPNMLQSNLNASAAIGARVMGTRIGGRFYVTDLISGGSPSEYVQYIPSTGWSLSPTTVMIFPSTVGWIEGTISCTAYAASAGVAGSFVVALDGVTVPGNGPFLLFNQSGVHMTLPTFQWRQAVTASPTHTITVITALSNDSNDRMSIRVRFNPA